MDKIYANLPITDDLRQHIKSLIKDEKDRVKALQEMCSILEYDDHIDLATRISLINEIIHDKKRAEKVAIKTCKGFNYQINSDPKPYPGLIQSVSIEIGDRPIQTDSFVDGKRVTYRHENYPRKTENALDLARGKRDVYKELGIGPRGSLVDEEKGMDRGSASTDKDIMASCMTKQNLLDFFTIYKDLYDHDRKNNE